MLLDLAIEPLRIAVSLLNLSYDQSEEVTEAQIETLKAYLGSDPGIGAVEEITATVIRRELNLEQNNQRRIRRGAQ